MSKAVELGNSAFDAVNRRKIRQHILAHQATRVHASTRLRVVIPTFTTLFQVSSRQNAFFFLVSRAIDTLAGGVLRRNEFPHRAWLGEPLLYRQSCSFLYTLRHFRASYGFCANELVCLHTLVASDDHITRRLWQWLVLFCGIAV